MNEKKNKFFAISYTLYDTTNGKQELVEKTTEDKNFNFITGMGIALEAFEKQVLDLNTGDKFEFTLSPTEAYGERDENYVLELEKEIFSRDGKFDDENVKVDAVLPLRSGDGKIFYGRVLNITDEKVKIDMNHPLAGKQLSFKGEVVETHEATVEEMAKWASMMSGEGGCSGCGGNCDGNCGDGGCNCGDGSCDCDK
ncbi:MULTISPECIES: FKBP-type peptidyl-prolyl cis-trans isomerase [Segatella]|jgi:FKBP-type peptidyl-prolyl cis-trans isomerase SlyD|uniref:FKBP-type peptidyl-prolyl cis-trans isomerase n=1 Tax=Segatella TaxID=2974251 RepID=UPI0004138351|nr:MULTISPECIES: FKBP-type peptidyl-prolyl cis-trans isomerase [Segatella]SDL68471.1 FKBP-type peptidyl prolyl cis-trans isomerase /Apo-metallochaperone SlyD [Segatella bryantii]